MKIAIAQLNFHIGNFEQNLSKILDCIKKAKTLNADLIIFSELAICGYPPRDFLEFDDFIKKCDDSIEQIRAASAGIGVIVGAPLKNPKKEGKDLFNAAYFIADEKINCIIKKTLLPTYDIFDEYRYFEPNSTFKVAHFRGKKIAITICEDNWNIGNENPLYTLCPMDELIKQNPDFMVNISASPFDFNQAEKRLKVMQANTGRYKLPLFYVNHVGAQTELIFDGGSLVLAANDVVSDELPYFSEAMKTYNLNDLQKPGQVSKKRAYSKIQLIHDALVLGISDYFKKLDFKKAILGLSGGIDSAVTLCLAVEALGSENVMSVLLPSEFSSNHSVGDAEKLLENTKSPSEKISIQTAFESFRESLKPQFKNLPFDLAEENMQARIRGDFF